MKPDRTRAKQRDLEPPRKIEKRSPRRGVSADRIDVAEHLPRVAVVAYDLPDTNVVKFEGVSHCWRVEQKGTENGDKHDQEGNCLRIQSQFACDPQRCISHRVEMSSTCLHGEAHREECHPSGSVEGSSGRSLAAWIPRRQLQTNPTAMGTASRTIPCA